MPTRIHADIAVILVACQASDAMPHSSDQERIGPWEDGHVEAAYHRAVSLHIASAAGSLVEKAPKRLKDGPLYTAEKARVNVDVIGRNPPPEEVALR